MSTCVHPLKYLNSFTQRYLTAWRIYHNVRLFVFHSRTGKNKQTKRTNKQKKCIRSHFPYELKGFITIAGWSSRLLFYNLATQKLRTKQKWLSVDLMTTVKRKGVAFKDKMNQMKTLRANDAFIFLFFWTLYSLEKRKYTFVKRSS